MLPHGTEVFFCFFLNSFLSLFLSRIVYDLTVLQKVNMCFASARNIAGHLVLVFGSNTAEAQRHSSD